MKTIQIIPYSLNKVALLLFMSIISHSGIFAQSISSMRDRIEFVGGPSWSSILGNIETDNSQFTTRKLKSGFSFGFSYTCAEKKRMQLELLLLYERKGTIAELSSPSALSTSSYSYSYISIPGYLNWKIGKSGALSIGIGAYADVLLKQTTNVVYPLLLSGGTSDETSLNSRFDIGVAGQIKYVIPNLFDHKVSLRIQNTYGLINTRLNPNSGQRWQSNNTLFVIGISLLKLNH